MLEYEIINDGICNLRMTGRYRNITIISVHAPMEGEEETRVSSTISLEET
jgi:hypothetical protein